MNKKIKMIIVIIIVFICISVTLLISISKEKLLTTNSAVNGIAIYVSNGTDYVSQISVPTGNYYLNSTLSYCVAKGEINSYDNTTGVISYFMGGADRCYLYFDLQSDSSRTGVASEVILNLIKNNSENLSYDDYRNVRYTGANPNNYVCFDDGNGGCINYDKDDASNKPGGLFRIIGVFGDDTHGQTGEKLVKLISADILGNTTIMWDSKEEGVGSSITYNGSSDWSDSQLMYMLNGFTNSGYYNGSQLHTGYTYNSSTYYISDGTTNIYQLYNGLSYLTGNGTTSLNVPADTTTSSGYIASTNSDMQTLTTTQANMIANVTWYLGGTADYSLNINGLANHWYDNERGTKTYYVESCDSLGSCSSFARPTTWIGKIGLMYMSDYGYATGGGSTCLSTELYNWDGNSDCYTNDWLLYSGSRTGTQGTASYQWTINTVLNYYENDGSFAFYADSEGYPWRYNAVDTTVYARPSFYLKSDVIIKGGSGTSTDPYRVGKKPTGADQIISLAATDSTNLATDDNGNVRYIGANPNNYACLSSDGTTCINYAKDNAANKPAGLFRIIGVFNDDTHGVTGEQLVKLISADKLGNANLKWDYKSASGLGSSEWGSGSNDWSDAQLMYMLNGFVNTGYNGTTQLHTGYSYNSSTYYISDGTYNIYQLYNGKSYLTGNGTTILNVPKWTTTSGYTASTNTSMQTLTTTQANMIATVTWKLGGTDDEEVLASQWYDYERGTETCYSMGDCSIIRPTTWTGKIGLIYPSDYGYATSGGSTCLSTELSHYDYEYVCYTNDWLLYEGSRTGTQGTEDYQWTITPHTSGDNVVFYIMEGFVTVCMDTGDQYGVRPAFYLESDVSISGGTGTSTDPYIFTMS